ncbi:hypothetical protein W822_02510 [Advenella kashmirensis W13003]|uniref:Uncharacterized protein n=1 Tax=Advenella kashmirensis W13003 TaxID=1424334 RepID=V8QYI6_9BURK|nr:type VI secretion system tip protein VgrG [Advenella kashmirensis]ETF04064.1 hypothetical protein W822_02510 [Advenella kashmirensis W13003]
MDIPNSIQFRSIVVRTPLGASLGFRRMDGSEGLSQLFDFDVELIADNYNVDLKSLLGKPLTIEMETLSGSRFLNGQVTRFELIGRENASSRYYIYKATVRPWLWYLTQTSDNKIFQQKSVPDVIKEVLGEYGYPFEMKLNGSYRNWEYCVQYQETDFAFVSRLMEHEGIYYYFRHEDGQHTLVMTDDISSHKATPGYDSIPYYGPDRLARPQDEYISMWEVVAQITSDGYATTDYDFTKPGASLDAVSKRSGGSENGNLEIYEWQGGFQEPDHGEQYSRVRLQELQSVQEQVRGIANARGVAPGYTFNLKNHPRESENKEYLVVSVNYRMSVSGYSTGTGSEDFYEESFIALPASVQYRAPRTTPIPRTHGPQTARVVGPAGEEIWTDKYGRIKVQFHWDRYGKKNENSSCWVRVSSPWAGGGFGGLQLPRIKDEVVVDFIGGCPDRPIVLGRVYNANNMPPVELPGSATISGFRSQSVFGDMGTTNMMLFDDTLGAELVTLKSQMDMVIKSLACADLWIGCDMKTYVGGNSHTTIGQSEYKKTGVERHDHVVGQTKASYEGGLHQNVKAATVERYENTRDVTTKGAFKELRQSTYNSKTNGAVTISMLDDATIYIKGNANMHVQGNMNLVVDGEWTADAAPAPDDSGAPATPDAPTDPVMPTRCHPK